MEFNLFLWLVLSVLLLSSIYLPLILFRRAVFQVIEKFRESSSICGTGHKKLDELGLRLPNFRESLFKPKDNLPYALRASFTRRYITRDRKDNINRPFWGIREQSALIERNTL